jgi:hypothetical protein
MLKELEAKTGQPKALFFVVFSLIIFGLIFAIGGFKLFSDLLGFIYPAYMSFKSLEGGKNIDGDATQWMTYWIVFCFVTLIESAFPFLIEYIKFYFLIKCAVVVWLFHPKTTGAHLQFGYSTLHFATHQRVVGNDIFRQTGRSRKRTRSQEGRMKYTSCHTCTHCHRH